MGFWLINFERIEVFINFYRGNEVFLTHFAHIFLGPEKSDQKFSEINSIHEVLLNFWLMTLFCMINELKFFFQIFTSKEKFLKKFFLKIKHQKFSEFNSITFSSKKIQVSPNFCMKN